MEDAGLRYDITVIYPGLIGSEYVKTLGHYHPKVPDNRGPIQKSTRCCTVKPTSSCSAEVR